MPDRSPFLALRTGVWPVAYGSEIAKLGVTPLGIDEVAVGECISGLSLTNSSCRSFFKAIIGRIHWNNHHARALVNRKGRKGKEDRILMPE